MTNQPHWRRSSRCETSACVEVAYTNLDRCESDQCVQVGSCACGTIHIRDSKHPTGPVLTFSRPEWDAFLAGVNNGEFDLD